MRKFPSFLFAALFLLSASLFGVAFADVVKQSNSGICHDEASAWYKRTKNFKAHGSMEACLGAGNTRAYKGYSGSARSVSGIGTASGNGATSYDRELYDHWIDADRDCQNTRHELLQELSTGQVIFNAKGCSVVHGRWNDPYTGIVFTTAREMDIDHMVPLAWAHAHGANQWDARKRREFANDRVNLFAVQASANRSKGAKGPLDWLPPNKEFHCQYVTRFHRVVQTYGLTYTSYEAGKMQALRTRVCG